MTAQEKDRIECAIRHIESSLDVDPWAVEIAVKAMKTQLSAEGTTSDLISRQAAIEVADAVWCVTGDVNVAKVWDQLKNLPSAQPTLCGYDIEHLILIANVLRKENLPPERITEVLTDIERIVSIVRDGFTEKLRKAVEQCEI